MFDTDWMELVAPAVLLRSSLFVSGVGMSDRRADASVLKNPPLTGKQHLHYVQQGGWGGGKGGGVVRTKKGVLCGTLRCQPVTILQRVEID